MVAAFLMPITKSIPIACICNHTVTPIAWRQVPSEEELVVAAFHNPRDAAEFAIELQSMLLEARWPKQVLEMQQFAPMYMAPR